MRKTQSRIFGRCSNLPGAEKNRQASCVRVHAHFKRGRLVSREGRRFRCGVLRGDRGARHGAQGDVRSSDCRRSPVAAWPRGETEVARPRAYRRPRSLEPVGVRLLRHGRVAKRGDAPARFADSAAVFCGSAKARRGAQGDVRSSGCRRSPVAAAWLRGETEVARPGALKAALVCANRSAFACRGGMAAWQSGAMRPCALIGASVRFADSAAVFCGSAKAQGDVRSNGCRRSPVAAWPRGKAGRCVRAHIEGRFT